MYYLGIVSNAITPINLLIQSFHIIFIEWCLNPKMNFWIYNFILEQCATGSNQVLIDDISGPLLWTGVDPTYTSLMTHYLMLWRI